MNLNFDFTNTTIPLHHDKEGKVIATLITSNKNTNNRKSILYIHGFVDYFFQSHLAKSLNESGFDFFALDLRKYGRSLLAHQRPNYCEKIEEYFEEITYAIDHIKKNNNAIYLLGHSTGGLIASCYMNKGELKKNIKGLILNSPFLDMPHPRFLTYLLYPILQGISKIVPYGKVSRGLSPIYVESIHKDYLGSWDFNLEWKPREGFPTYFKWAIAIVDAQRSLKNSSIPIPILLLHSDKSFIPKKHSKKVMNSDIILNVEDMKNLGPTLGNDTTLVEIKNGQHDLFLSADENSRKIAFKAMLTWLEKMEE